MVLSRIGKRVAAVAVIGVIAIGCKPKPVDSVAAPPVAEPVANTMLPPPAPMQAAQGSASPVQQQPTAPASTSDAAHQHQHPTSKRTGDINEVADQLSSETKAQLEKLIDERNRAKPIVHDLPGGGQMIELNGSQTSIAVGVMDEDGNTVIYHHGENFRPQKSSGQSANP